MWNRSENKINCIFIRHGCTVSNREHRYLGRTDEPLYPFLYTRFAFILYFAFFIIILFFNLVYDSFSQYDTDAPVLPYIISPYYNFIY